MKRTFGPFTTIYCGLLSLLVGCKTMDEATSARGRDAVRTIHDAASKGDIAAVQRFLQGGVDVNAKTTATKRADVDELTPLIVAAQAGHVDMVKFLVDNGANVNASSTDGTTALIIAAKAGHMDVVKLLVDEGANVNHRRAFRSALEYAAEAGHLDLVKFLIDKTTDVNRDDKNVRMAVLSEAVRWGHLDLVTFCVDNGVDVKRDDTNWLGLAASWGRLDIVQFLVSKGCDVNRKIRIIDSYESPLWAAAAQGHTEVVEFLLKKNARDQSDIRKAMAIAMQRGYSQTAGVLLDYFVPDKANVQQPE